MNPTRIVYCIVLFFMVAPWAQAQKEAGGDSLIKAFFNDSDSHRLTRNDYAQSTENAFQLLNGAQTEAALGWKVLEAKEKLKANRKVVRALGKALKSHTNSGFRDLQLYSYMLQDIQEENRRIREVLEEAEQQLQTAKKNIKTITADSVIIQMVRENVGAPSRRNQTGRLQKEYIQTALLLKSSLDSVHRWSASASFMAISTAEMLQKTDSIMQQSSIRALKGDCAYLWQASNRVAERDTSTAAASSNSSENHRVITYYVQKNLDRILWIPILLFGLFFRWVRKNYKRVRTFSDLALQNDPQLRFTKRSAVLLAVIIGLSLFPLLDVHAPWFYLLLIQCISAGAVTYFFLRKETRSIVPVWLVLLGLLVGISVANSLEPDLFQRCVLIVLNALSIGATVFLFPRIKHVPQMPRTIRIVAFVTIALHGLAIVCNVFGRVIIAEALTNSAIIGLTQIIALSVFLEAIIEALYLQLLASRIKRGIPPEFDHQPVLKAIHRPLFIFVLLMWAMMFTANLYMYEMIRTMLVAGLRTSMSLGSLSFTIGNMLLFFVIIWIAHLLQQYIGSFFGDTENDEDLESKKQRSRMMVIKLAVICIGYLLAVAASGLPLDKITIVLGALGVGVGMGLQSIVNNFVSGVVLIFDRPLQIGDSIEVGPNKGKVKAIGIRSSTLLTADGAEVIIPNGDILSSPITNWTLSNNQRRLELEFKLQTTETKDALMELIKTTLMASSHIATERDITFLVENVTEDKITLKVFFWCNNISKADWIKSEARYLLYGAFHRNNILVL